MSLLDKLHQLRMRVRPALRRLRTRTLQAIELRLRGDSAHSRLQNLQQRVEQLESLLLGDPIAPPGPQALRRAGFSSPAVSIVMPVYNRAHGVVEAIASVIAQSFTDWELIVVDDGSSDGSAEAVEPFSLDPRIRCIRQAHRGGAAALNRGQAQARGHLVAYLDSDNLWYPDFLAVAVAAFAADPSLQCAYGALVSDVHFSTGERVLFRSFDRGKLLLQNYIDQNTFIHRRDLIATHGGYDETLVRLTDWDLVLRYTRDEPARRLPVLAARYRVLDEQRISVEYPAGPSYLQVRRKWFAAEGKRAPLRLLYVVWHYPQLSETYVETEIRCMLRLGVHVEVWAQIEGVAPYDSAVRVHRGTLAQAIEQSNPNILHAHWLSFVRSQRDALAAARLPLTVRTHGFDTSDDTLSAVLALGTVRRIFCFPHEIPKTAAAARLQPLQAAFDTTLFRPQRAKDRRLVLRTSAALPSKNLELFFEVAKRLPHHRCVLAVVTCSLQEAYVDELTALWKAHGSPGELLIDVPRDELARLVEQAGLYLHTARLPGEAGGTPIGMPISIAEAMATGAHVLVRAATPLVAYAGEAGRAYRDAGHAVALIDETTRWPEARWNECWTRSVDRAFHHHADDIALRPIYDEWCDIERARTPAAVAH